MPVCNALLAHLPAKQDHLILHDAREIEQSGIQVLHLHADGIDLGESVFRRLYGFVLFGATPSE